MPELNICIVEDNKLILENLRLLLQGEPHMSVVGAFATAEEALKRVNWNRTDVLLADIDLPGMSGVELIGQVKAEHANVEVLAYTICEDRAVVMSAIRAGASGYLLKGSSPRELIESIRELHAGGAPMSPRIARKIISEIRAGQPGESAAGAAAGIEFTSREIGILRLLEKGMSYTEISEKLNISPHTVHSHIKKIYEKVQAGSRAEMLAKARRMGAI